MEVVLGETLSSDVRDGTGKLEREKNKNRRRKLVRLSLLEMGLDFNFPAQLVFQAFLLYLGLEQDFQGHDEMVFLQASQVHIPEFSLAERTPDFKIIDCETPPWQERKQSASVSEVGGESGVPRARLLLSRFPSPGPFSFLRVQPGCWVRNCRSPKATLHTCG